jgi:hypothetical protein
MEAVYEQFFFLKYSGGWSLTEAYNLPLGLRTWFVERLLKQLQQEKEAIEEASKGKGSSRSQNFSLNEHNQPKMPDNLKNWIGGPE